MTRKGIGSTGRIWLTFNGGMKTTVVLAHQEAGQLTGLIGDASGAQQSR